MLVSLTPEFLATQLVCPPGRTRVEFVDRDGVRGLYVECRATSPGEGTYYLRYKDAGGKTCHQRLGGTRDMTLAEARAAARKLKAKIVLGGDPRAEAKAKRAVITFDELISDHYWSYVKPRKRSWKRDEQLYRLRIKKAFGRKRLTEISRHQIQLFHTALAEEGLAPATCDLHIKFIKHALALGVDWGFLDRSPAAGVPLFNADNRVENYLTDEELDRLMGTLRGDANRPVCQVIRFMLATSIRRGEALAARWDAISRSRRVLVIDASTAKGKRTREVPLSDAALAVLDELDTEGKYDYLFINPRTKKPYVSITRSWHRIRRDAGLSHLRLHDMRHNMAALMANSGRTLLEIQYVLGHRDPRMSLRYAKLQNRTLLDAANSAAPALMRGSESVGSATSAGKHAQLSAALDVDEESVR